MGISLAAILGIAAVSLAAVGTGVSIYAASAQAEGQKKALKFQQKAREQEAESARQSAAYEEHQFRRRMAILMGRQEAITGASGLDPTVGTPLLTEIDTAKQGSLEALNIRRTGAISAAGSELEGRLAGIKGRFTEQAGMYNMLGTGLSGASSVLGSWSTSQGYNRLPRYSYGQFNTNE